MFEKEAEEYREKGKNEGYYLVVQEMEQEELDYIIDESFKDGAEFGYNKAKEELEKENAEAKDIIEDLIAKIPASLVEHFESEKERAEKFLGWK